MDRYNKGKGKVRRVTPKTKCADDSPVSDNPKQTRARGPTMNDGCRFFIGHVKKGIEDQNINPKPKIKDLKDAWGQLPKEVKEFILSDVEVTESTPRKKKVATDDDGDDYDDEAPKKVRAQGRRKRGEACDQGPSAAPRRGHPKHGSFKFNLSVDEVIKICTGRYKFCTCHLENPDDSSECVETAPKRGRKPGRAPRNLAEGTVQAAGGDDCLEPNEDQTPNEEGDNSAPERGDDIATPSGGAPKRKLKKDNNPGKAKRRKAYELSQDYCYSLEDEDLDDLLDTAMAKSKKKRGEAGAQPRKGRKGDRDPISMEVAEEEVVEALEADTVRSTDIRTGSDVVGNGHAGGKTKCKVRKSDSQDTFHSDTESESSCSEKSVSSVRKNTN